MKVAVLFLLVTIYSIPHCFCGAIEEKTTKETDSHGINKRDATLNFYEAPQTESKCKNGRDGRDGLMGPQGERGSQGEQGLQGERGPPGPSGGGAVYTIWGRVGCPEVNGTEEIHKGYTVGGLHRNQGGGANYLCITKTPEYLATTVSTSTALAHLYRTEYQVPDNNLNNYAVPCAVCNTPQRSTKLMLPGQVSCPPSWTEEYDGYLVAERTHDAHKQNAVYECLDDNSEIVEGRAKGNYIAALMDYVVAKCGSTLLPCPPFVNNKPITCVVCTK